MTHHSLRSSVVSHDIKQTPIKLPLLSLTCVQRSSCIYLVMFFNVYSKDIIYMVCQMKVIYGVNWSFIMVLWTWFGTQCLTCEQSGHAVSAQLGHVTRRLFAL